MTRIKEWITEVIEIILETFWWIVLWVLYEFDLFYMKLRRNREDD